MRLGIKKAEVSWSMRDDNSIKIKKSGIEGLGVFAARDFKKEEKIYSFKKGKIVSRTDIQNMPKEEKKISG